MTDEEFEKGRKDYIVFKGTDSIEEMLDYVLQFKGEAKGIKKKTVEFKLYLLAIKGLGLDSYFVLNNLPKWRTVVSLIKKGSGIVTEFFQRLCRSS